MANASPEIAQPTETQRAETAANRFSDMAEKGPGAKNPKMREIFQNVGDETRSGNFDKAQRLLEGGATWDDNLRGAASEVNRLDQEKRRAKPMSFGDAQKMTDVYALRHEAQATRYDEGSATRTAHLEHVTSLRGASRSGVEGIDDTLQYIEQGLKDMAEAASKGPLTREELQDWQEKRAIRDALYQEKQKRVEQMKQSQRGTEELTKGRESTTRGLGKLYADAGVPEGTASRQEFFGRVSAMSPEELHFLDSALNRAAREAMRSGDPKMLEGLLGDLSTKSFKRKDVEVRQNAEDQRKIEEIRRKMGLPEQQPPRTEESPPDEKTPEQKAEAAKAKFNHFLNRLSSGLLDPTINQDFAAFIESNPTPEQYEAAGTRLSKLYKEYSGDQRVYGDRMEPGGRLVSEKLAKYREKLREVADTLNTNRKRETGAPLRGDNKTPVVEEAPEQEKGANPFEKLFGSPKIAEVLDTSDKHVYTPDRGAAAMTEALKTMYPDVKRFTARTESLLRDFRSAQTEARRKKPDADEWTINVMAANLLGGKLPEAERQMMNKLLKENTDRGRGGEKLGKFTSEMAHSLETILPDFIKFIEKLKK